jgi:hypothetical protein
VREAGGREWGGPFGRVVMGMIFNVHLRSHVAGGTREFFALA